MKKISVRDAKRDEWPDVLRIHRRAIYEIASADYSIQVLSAWGPPIKNEDLPRMIAEFDAKLYRGQIIIVAENDGCLAGFGEVAPNRNLLVAIYINPDYVRQGVGSAILVELERLACKKNLQFLQLDSSLTAFPFYETHGYKSLGRDVHILRNGKKMECVKMRKDFI
ncbi:MAG: GNAT family N-acetyltransferase [Desulfobacteraceae bacterium]|nr:MAG: GNAT family N-acetyltransferase [Desulfobacteraceae bacterium]